MCVGGACHLVSSMYVHVCVERKTEQEKKELHKTRPALSPVHGESSGEELCQYKNSVAMLSALLCSYVTTLSFF